MKPRKMEWSLIVGVITAVLDYIVGFHLSFLNAEQAALWVTLISAVAAAVVAWKTRPVPPSVYVYLTSAGAALLTAYGLHLSPEHVATFSAAVVALLAYWQRSQVTPAADVKAGLVAPDGVTVVQPGGDAAGG